MLLSEEQFDLLKGDLDYILARTSCNSIQLTKGQVSNAIERDPDVLLDLVEGLPASEARWLSVPLDALRPLINRRARGGSGRSAIDEGGLLIPV
ncbi:MAG: hypothetical protein WC076_06955 [Terrimicrobiaceae bacterium]|jgi:hypothetical protein|nr:hypothetical protein [Terrimicrobiaceae bacterium]